MSQFEAVMFDADGVLTLPEDYFSKAYTRKFGLEEGSLNSFFNNEFASARLGRADLREVLAANLDVFQWDKPVDDLLEFWFKSEDLRNEPMLELVREIGFHSIKCYVATNQERYRAEYMEQEMFPGLFDGYIVSAHLGVEKPNPGFYTGALRRIGEDIITITPEQVAFFDDSPENVEGARVVGIQGHLFESPRQVSEILLSY